MLKVILNEDANNVLFIKWNTIVEKENVCGANLVKFEFKLTQLSIT